MPEYLKLRFDEKTRASERPHVRGHDSLLLRHLDVRPGPALPIGARLEFHARRCFLSAAIVLVYTFLGGLTSAIYNEVLQFFLIILGFAPLAIMAVMRAGGWAGMASRVPDVMTHTWTYVGSSPTIRWASKLSD